MIFLRDFSAFLFKIHHLVQKWNCLMSGTGFGSRPVGEDIKRIGHHTSNIPDSPGNWYKYCLITLPQMNGEQTFNWEVKKNLNKSIQL
jgi:hypothetical protein